MTVDVYTIAVALGRSTPDPSSPEGLQWEMWISDALMLIQARITTLALAGITTPADLDQTQLDYVVREAVVAQVRRPDDATTVDVRVDDGAVAKTYRSSAGRVTIRDEWWNLLFPSDSTSGAFSIRPSGCGEPHLPWCSLTFGALYCSCGTDIADHPIFELEGYL